MATSRAKYVYILLPIGAFLVGQTLGQTAVPKPLLPLRVSDNQLSDNRDPIRPAVKEDTANNGATSVTVSMPALTVDHKAVQDAFRIAMRDRVGNVGDEGCDRTEIEISDRVTPFLLSGGCRSL